MYTCLHLYTHRGSKAVYSKSHSQYNHLLSSKCLCIKMTGSIVSRNPVGRNEIHSFHLAKTFKNQFSKMCIFYSDIYFVSMNIFKIASLHSYWLTVLAMAMEQISPLVQRCRHLASRYPIK